MAQYRGIKRWLQRWLRHPVEYLLLRLAMSVVRRLPVDSASNLGGWLAHSIGPHLPVTATAYRNLRLAFPNKDRGELKRIVLAMWDNLGRTAAEYVHLNEICDVNGQRIELLGEEHLEPLFNRDMQTRRGGIVVSGHFGNWEVLPMAASMRGMDISLVVRQPNNPLVEKLLDQLRAAAGARVANKGAEGSKEAIRTLSRGTVLGVLIDQKMNNGIAVPFFGHDAMTTPGPAQLAIRFQCPLIMVRIERLGAARFRVTCMPPLPLPAPEEKDGTARLTRRMNEQLEAWIAERPQEWFWLHRRWPQSHYHATPEAERDAVDGLV
jgi:KDO2-lipid IV(A) lauroyltransferase